MRVRCAFVCLTLLLCAAPARAQHPEALSLLGKPLVPPPLAPDVRRALDTDLAQARVAVEQDPNSADAMLALGRATARLGRVTEALEIFTRAIEAHPDDAPLYLERGRGYIVIRKFDVALKDFRKAAEALPAARCDEGFALYLKAEFKAATGALRQCDGSPWAYAAARRAGTAPPSKPGASADAVLTPYLAAVEALASGRTDQAKDLLEAIVEKNHDDWMTPAYIAAEADYARVNVRRPRVRR